MNAPRPTSVQSLLVRAASLDFARDELERATAEGEETLAAAAQAEFTGDPLRDAGIALAWQERIELAMDRYMACIGRLAWELRDCGALR